MGTLSLKVNRRIVEHFMSALTEIDSVYSVEDNTFHIATASPQEAFVIGRKYERIVNLINEEDGKKLAEEKA